MWKVIWMFRQCLCQGPLALAQSTCSSECEFLDCSLYLQKRVTGYMYFDSAFFSLNIYVCYCLCVYVWICCCTGTTHVWTSKDNVEQSVFSFHHVGTMAWTQNSSAWLKALSHAELAHFPRIFILDLYCFFFFYFLCNNFWKLLIHVIKTSLAMWLFKII